MGRQIKSKNNYKYCFYCRYFESLYYHYCHDYIDRSSPTNVSATGLAAGLTVFGIHGVRELRMTSPNAPTVGWAVWLAMAGTLCSAVAAGCFLKEGLTVRRRRQQQQERQQQTTIATGRFSDPNRTTGDQPVESVPGSLAFVGIV